jgi:hypothetical protein
MRKSIKKISITMILFLSLILITNTVLADPQLNSLTTNPLKPEPESEVTVIVNFTGENIISVRGYAVECYDDNGNDPSPACYQNTELTLSLNDDGLFEDTFNLKDYEGITDHIEWIFYVNDSGVEYEIEGGKTYLDLEPDTPNNNNNDKGTPGFEILLLLVAILIGVLYYKKKR